MRATVTVTLADGREATTTAPTALEALISLAAWAGSTPIVRLTGSARRGLAVLTGGAR